MNWAVPISAMSRRGKQKGECEVGEQLIRSEEDVVDHGDCFLSVSSTLFHSIYFFALLVLFWN